MNKLYTMDGDTLMNTPLKPIKFIVEKLLPQGLHILAGSPKIGKSWMSLWLCLQVAKGEPVWNFPSVKCTVLYLCLEDSFSRIQNRLLDITDEAPEQLHFATMSQVIGNGLENQIKAFTTENPDTGLIVIDTLQKIRNIGSGVNPYASDYHDIGVLKKLADDLGISILLIHHLRKMTDDDPTNMISGTTGISGATDSNFVLKLNKRGSSEATLYCTGRDIEYRELQLELSATTHIWELNSDSAIDGVPPGDSIISLLKNMLKEKTAFTGTATELSNMIQKEYKEQILPNILIKRMIRYQSELQTSGIQFSTKRTHDRKEIQLKYECVDCVGNDGKFDSIPVSDLPTQSTQNAE